MARFTPVSRHQVNPDPRFMTVISPSADVFRQPTLPTAPQAPTGAAPLRRRRPAGGGGGGGVDIPRGPTQISEVDRTTTQATQAGRAPELEAMLQETMGRIGGLRTGFEEAFGGYGESFNDLMRYLADAYRTQGSAGAQATGQAALTAGLSPLEATGAAGTQWQQALRELYPQLAGLRAQQAQVPIQLQQALQGVLTGAELPAVGQIAAPYYRDVAGRTGTTTEQGTQTVEDLLGRAQLQANIQAASQQGALQQQQLDLQRYLGQLGSQTDLQRAAMALQGQQAGQQTQMGIAQMQAAAQQQGIQQRGVQDLLRTQLQQQLLSEREIAEREFGAAQAGEQRIFEAQQAQLARDAEMARIEHMYPGSAQTANAIVGSEFPTMPTQQGTGFLSQGGNVLATSASALNIPSF